MPASLTTWRAHSYSRTLVDLLNPASRAFRVFSTHTHACNLVSPYDEWIALVDEQHGNGPFHVVVPFAMLPMRRMQEPVTIGEGLLHFAHACLDLRSAICWEPRLPVTLIAPHTLFWLYEEIALSPTAVFGFTPVVIDTLLTRMAAGIHALTQGLQRQDRQQLSTGVQKLAGLGPGLTPAGDDFLLGFMAAFMIQAPYLLQPLTANEVCTLIDAVAAGQTTRLSAAWLHCAAQGNFGAPWHELAQALAKGQPMPVKQAARRIVATGATSGRAALAGFVHALRLLGKADD